MIEDEIKRIREAEENAVSRIQEAERKSKKRVEEEKKRILKDIEERRKKLLEEIEVWKKNAEVEGRIEGAKILEEYQEMAKKIKGISEQKIQEVAKEVLLQIFR